MTVVVGVDPGAAGGVVALSGGLWAGGFELSDFYAVEDHGGRSPVNMLQTGLLADALAGLWPSVIVVEKQNPRPGNSSRSSTTAAMNWGRLTDVVRLSGVSSVWVAPATWKRDVGCPADKRGAVALASRLVPEGALRFVGPRGGLRDGMAEAALVALWWHRQTVGCA